MKTRVDSPTRHHTSGGRTIYAICTEVFPNFFGNQTTWIESPEVIVGLILRDGVFVGSA